MSSSNFYIMYTKQLKKGEAYGNGLALYMTLLFKKPKRDLFNKQAKSC